MTARFSSDEPGVKQAVLEFFAKAFSELGHDFDLTGKDRDLEEIASVYQSEGCGFWLVQDGKEHQVVGTIALRRLDEEFTELKRFYVLRDWQGRGLGRSLLEAAIGHAKAEGFKRIRLDTTSQSPAAIHLFKDRGFSEIGRYNDDPFAEFFFELELGDPSSCTEL